MWFILQAYISRMPLWWQYIITFQLYRHVASSFAICSIAVPEGSHIRRHRLPTWKEKLILFSCRVKVIQDVVKYLDRCRNKNEATHLQLWIVKVKLDATLPVVTILWRAVQNAWEVLQTAFLLNEVRDELQYGSYICIGDLNYIHPNEEAGYPIHYHDGSEHSV